jgi:hypothetical protein
MPGDGYSPRISRSRRLSAVMRSFIFSDSALLEPRFRGAEGVRGTMVADRGAWQ